jgi:hypothetical protein
MEQSAAEEPEYDQSSWNMTSTLDFQTYPRRCDAPSSIPPWWAPVSAEDATAHPSGWTSLWTNQAPLLPSPNIMYCCSLLQIAPSLSPLTACLPPWLVTPRRPMSLGEFSTALPSRIITSDTRSLVKQGVAPCRGLLALEGRDVTVQLPEVSLQCGPQHVDVQLVGLCARYI